MRASKSKAADLGLRAPRQSSGARIAIGVCAFVFVIGAFAAVPSTNAPAAAPPVTPRQFFNAGTQKLSEGKLREAEAFLESTLASQQARLQPPALYNLGHVRFRQGTEELKKSLAAGPAASGARRAEKADDAAIRLADEALGGEDLEQLVAAYIHGRGARKEGKAAAEAVRRALEAHGATLRKWERASGDFKGAVELNTSEADAAHNAEVVDRCIARLVDSLRQMQQCAKGLGDKNRALGEKLKQLKGRIPASQMPPGAAGDEDEDDEESPLGQKPGEKEGPSKEGQEMTFTAEQAAWFLQGFRLDSERRLPMSEKEAGKPRERSRPTW